MNPADTNAPPVLHEPPPPRSGGRWWKWLLGIFAVLALLFVLLILSFDRIVCAAVRKRIETVTGMKTDLARFEIRFLKPSLHIEGFRLANLEEFGGGTFLDLPEATVTVDREALSDRKLHLKFARVSI